MIIRHYKTSAQPQTVSPEPITAEVAAPVLEVVPVPAITEREAELPLSAAASATEEAPPLGTGWATGFTVTWTHNGLTITENPERPDGTERMKKTNIITLQGKGGSQLEVIIVPGGIEEESEVSKAETEAETSSETSAPPGENA